MPQENRPVGKAETAGKSAVPPGAPDVEPPGKTKPYIRAAMAADEINLQAVAEAKELLESGRLDSPQAARRAAEAIIRQGI